MKYRHVSRIVPAVATMEGAGVTVHRTIGTSALRNLDPFLLLDNFSSDDPDDYIAGFPDHPHRGFNTFTYMLDGHMRHRDSMGNSGEVGPGGAQWMKAASGVIHSEMPRRSAGLLRGFQLWINLPAAEKMSAPAYQELRPEAIPVVEENGARVKILLGEYQGRHGGIHDPNTRVQYLDVSLRPGGEFSTALAPDYQGFVYIFEGAAALSGHSLPTHSLALLGEGDALILTATEQGARFLLVAGMPIREPVVQYGPFVMNTREEIEQAFADYREGRLVREKASVTGDAGAE